jgi:hypothetical protein
VFDCSVALRRMVNEVIRRLAKMCSDDFGFSAMNSMAQQGLGRRCRANRQLLAVNELLHVPLVSGVIFDARQQSVAPYGNRSNWFAISII